MPPFINYFKEIGAGKKIGENFISSWITTLCHSDPEIRQNHLNQGKNFWFWMPHFYANLSDDAIPNINRGAFQDWVRGVIYSRHTDRFITLCQTITQRQEPQPFDGAYPLLENLSRLRAEDADRWVAAVQNTRPTTVEAAVALLEKILNLGLQNQANPNLFMRQGIALEIHREAPSMVRAAQNFFNERADAYRRAPQFPSTKIALQTLAAIIDQIHWEQETASSEGEKVTAPKALEILHAVTHINMDSPITRLRHYLPFIVHHMTQKGLLPLYVTNWITDSANAYNAGDKTSCIPGIGERMISTALSVDPELNTLFSRMPETYIRQMQNHCSQHTQNQTAEQFIQEHLGQPLSPDLPLEAKHEAFFQAFLKAEGIDQAFLDQQKDFEGRGLEAILRKNWVSNLPPEAFMAQKEPSKSPEASEINGKLEALNLTNQDPTTNGPLQDASALPSDEGDRLSPRPTREAATLQTLGEAATVPATADTPDEGYQSGEDEA